MKKLIVVLSFALSGCFYQSVNFSDIDNAAKFCGGVQDIAELSANFLGGESVICHDRSRTTLKER